MVLWPEPSDSCDRSGNGARLRVAIVLVLGKRLQLPLALQRLAVAFAVFDCGTVSLREMARQAKPPQVR